MAPCDLAPPRRERYRFVKETYIIALAASSRMLRKPASLERKKELLKVLKNPSNKTSLILITCLGTMFLIALSSSFSSSFSASNLGHSISSSSIVKTNSVNWGGYVITGPSGSVTSVNASWVAPTITCKSGEETWVSVEVGIDSSPLGPNNGPAEGVGLVAACGTTGGVEYYADVSYDNSTRVCSGCGGPSVIIAQGDHISGQVSIKGSTAILRLNDVTRHSKFLEKITGVSIPRSTAEFVVWTDFHDLTSVGVTDFNKLLSGNVYVKQFKNSDWATIAGHTGSFASFMKVSGVTVSQVTFVDSSNNVLASPSSLSTNGRSFSITWQAFS